MYLSLILLAWECGYKILTGLSGYTHRIRKKTQGRMDMRMPQLV